MSAGGAVGALQPRKIAGYGWKPDLPDPRDHMLSLETPTTLPAEVDLRTSGHLPPVYDQDQLGSCTANASGAAMEYLQAMQGLTPIMPSRLFIYYNERVLEGTVDQDSGAQIRDAVKVLNKLGVCPEADWPYDIRKFALQPPAKDFTEALGERAVAYKRVLHSATSIKTALAHGMPVIIGFTVFDAFESAEVARTGMVELPAPGEKNLGGHAVLVVGYKVINGKHYWIVRNSWGAGWGDGGYFYMAEKYLTRAGYASDYWTISLVGK